MKAEIKLGIMCVFGAMTPVALAAPVSAEEVAASTIPGYSISFSGGGWSAADKARAALSKVDGIDKIMLSGMTAFVTMTDGTDEVDKGDLREAFKPRGLKLERVKKREIVAPVETWQIKVKGGTWATTNERLRADLEKLDEVSAAFVNAGEITLMMAKADSYDEEEIGKMTKKRKSEIVKSTKLNSSPL